MQTRGCKDEEDKEWGQGGEEVQKDGAAGNSKTID